MATSGKLVFTLFVLGLVAQAHSLRERRGIDWNEITDSLLRHAKEEIESQGKSRVALPDVHETFTKKKGFIRLKGEFRATGGWLESFASLHRVGDATVTKQDSASVLTVVLGLSDLRLGYDRYEARFWGNGPVGTIEGRIGKNAVKFVLKFDQVDDGCKTTVEELRVVEFDDFNVNVAGLGSFDWLAEKVVESIVNKRRNDIKESIERQLGKEMLKALKDFECDEYAAFMIPI